MIKQSQGPETEQEKIYPPLWSWKLQFPLFVALYHQSSQTESEEKNCFIVKVPWHFSNLLIIQNVYTKEIMTTLIGANELSNS